MITIPEFDVYSRFAASRLTSYGYEEIVSAANEHNEAERAYNAAIIEAGKVLSAHPDYRDPGFRLYAEPPYSALMDVLEKYCLTGADTFGRNREYWPVRNWQKRAAQFRRGTAQIIKATRAIG